MDKRVNAIIKQINNGVAKGEYQMEFGGLDNAGAVITCRRLNKIKGIYAFVQSKHCIAITVNSSYNSKPMLIDKRMMARINNSRLAKIKRQAIKKTDWLREEIAEYERIKNTRKAEQLALAISEW